MLALGGSLSRRQWALGTRFESYHNANIPFQFNNHNSFKHVFRKATKSENLGVKLRCSYLALWGSGIGVGGIVGETPVGLGYKVRVVSEC